MDDRIGIIGGTGWLGHGIARHLILSGMINPKQLMISNQSGRRLEESWGDQCEYTLDNQRLVDRCHTVVLAVRPQQMNQMAVSFQHQLVISIMAGMTVKQIADRTGAERVVRSMPNAALDIGASFTPWYAEGLSEGQLERVSDLLSTFGAQARVDNEDHINFFTAMTGSGQGILSCFASCMIDSAVKQGIESEVAELAARQLFSGVGQLMSKDSLSPHDVVDICLQYAGTTAAAIQSLQSSGLSGVVDKALQSAYQLASSDMSQ